MSSKPSIPEEDRIPVKDKLIVSSGGIVEYSTNYIITGQLWMPVFNIGFGMSPALLGLINMIFKIWDAIIDPVIGNMSDNTRSRWGRRRPYIVVFAVLTGLLAPVVWHMNPEWGDAGKIAWITGFGLLLFSCASLWGMPYYSFLLELTPNYDERTRLAAYRTLVNKLMGLGGAWVFALVASSYFSSTDTGEPDLVLGAKYVTVGVGLSIIIFGTLPGLFVKERYYEKHTKHEAKEGLIKSVKETFTCKPLWQIIGMVFFNIMGSHSLIALSQYLNIYYVNKGEIADASIIEGWKSTAMAIAGILSIPFWTWFCERFDKKAAMFVILGAAFIGHALNWYCIDPEYPYLQLIPPIFNASIVGALWLIIPSMTADVADYDELHTSLRREGSLNAVFSWTLHTAFAIALGLSGVLLQITGFDAELGGNQPEGVMDTMFILFMCFPFVMWTISILFLRSYNLDRSKMKEIRLELEARRGKL